MSSNACRVLGLCILVKIVLRAFPITGPPRAVVCCRDAIRPSRVSIFSPASTATAPALSIPFVRSSALTANLTSTAAILSIILVVFKVASPSPLIAAVNPFTDSAASIPVSLVRVRASLVLLRVSSIERPCRENSRAASAATLKLDAVFFATAKSLFPNPSKVAEEAPRTTFISVNVFSSSIDVLTRLAKAF